MLIRAADADSYRGLPTVHPVHEEICRAIRHALREDGNDLAARPDAIDELTAQACAVFDEVVAVVTRDATSGASPGAAAVGDPAVPPGAGDQLRRGLDWAHSLRAGTALFEVMLPIALRELSPADETAAARVSVLLHQAVLARVVRGSLARMTALPDRALALRQDERRHIARELHDRVLHEIGLALQGIDMHQYHAESSPALARAKLNRAAGLLRQAVYTLQHFTTELRRSVGEGGLERALRSYLDTHADPAVDITVRTSGDLLALPPYVSEEAYLILREAARNALRHAAPSRLDLTVEVTDGTLYAAVTDDGCGFLVGATPGGNGLSSMRERAKVLGGELTLSSAPEVGTVVEVRAPLWERDL
ncbi:two-component sensor histidine kinase [Streptomyces griseoviridis]|uniref:Two-component sensor histidine kinase n=1 Tax=Streptomyces griseoviridis TaxID=45398 RepID=A0A918G3Z7_STRGD|nr:two-component sensor histidine kinase [Streptomyces niveoruber]